MSGWGTAGRGRMSCSEDHAVLAERFVEDEAKWAALRKLDEGSAPQGVVADVVMIDDHDDTSRVELDVRPTLPRLPACLLPA